jgi:hypothetical protein
VTAADAFQVASTFRLAGFHLGFLCEVGFKALPESLRKPRNRPAAHIVAAANLRKRLDAMIAALDRLAFLMIGELWLTSQVYASRLRPDTF